MNISIVHSVFNIQIIQIINIAYICLLPLNLGHKGLQTVSELLLKRPPEPQWATAAAIFPYSLRGWSIPGPGPKAQGAAAPGPGPGPASRRCTSSMRRCTSSTMQ